MVGYNRDLKFAVDRKISSGQLQQPIGAVLMDHCESLDAKYPGSDVAALAFDVTHAEERLRSIGETGFRFRI